MLIDAFIFNHELDLLEIRFNTLKDVVDKFVIYESALSFSGKPKEKIFAKNAERFKEFWDKCVYVEVPTYSSNFIWANEWGARNMLAAGLSGCSKDDYVMLSDVDEIPNPEILKNWDKVGLTVLEQHYLYYKFNLISENNPKWPGTVIGQYKDLNIPENIDQAFSKEFGFQAWREQRGNLPRVANGGWHFSYCFSEKDIQKKIEDFCHAPDLNKPEINNTNHIQNCISKGESLNAWGDKGDGIKLIKTNATLPDYVNNNQEKFKDLFAC